MKEERGLGGGRGGEVGVWMVSMRCVEVRNLAQQYTVLL